MFATCRHHFVPQSMATLAASGRRLLSAAASGARGTGGRGGSGARADDESRRQHRWSSPSALAGGVGSGFLAGCCLTAWWLRRPAADGDGVDLLLRRQTPLLARSFASTATAAAADSGAPRRPTPPAGVNHIADIVELVSPSAVNIRVEGTTMLHSMLGLPSMQGSGFIIREDGLILTNAHVAGRFKGNLVVTLTDGRELPAQLLAIDVESDMALVKVDAHNLPVLPLGHSKRCRAGEWVIAIGSPLTLSNTVTVGILSNTARNLGTASNIEYLQTDAAITFGNSGGPLVDMQGQAIGINTLKADAGISFAIPIDEARNFVEQALSTSRRLISRPKAYLGLTLWSLTPAVSGLVFGNRPGTEVGVLVHSVHPDSPAQRAGLARFDIIVAADGEPVRRVSDLNRVVFGKLLASGSGGRSVVVQLTVMRDGRQLTITVQPELQS